MKQNSLSKSIKKPTPVVLIDEDQQKKNNFGLIGKMFGNMSESINIGGNLGKINNPSTNKFSGGFKQQSIVKNNKTTLQQKDHNKSELKKADVFTVYDEFGLINDSIGKRDSISKGKPKYRQDDPQGNSSLPNPFKLQDPSTFTQMKQNRRQQFQQVMSSNYVNLHEYYDLAKEKDRQQTVIHVKSSLDNMTLENVEAKLEAHRRQLKSIEKQYKAKKGVSEKDQQEDDNVANPSYLPNKTFTKTGQDNPYKQYGKTQSQIYEMIKKNQKDDQGQIVVDQLWEEKLKQNPKLLQYSKKYEEYLVQKDAKNILYGTVRQNLFKWDKFTQPQSHHKSTSKIVRKSLSKEKSISKLNKSLQKIQREASLEKSQYMNSNIRQVLASKDDKFIAKYIFAQVDVDKRGLLSKEELLDYIAKNEHIIKSYNIDLKWIYTDLDNYETKRKGMLNKDQLAIFLATFQRNFHPEIKLTDVSELSGSKKDVTSQISQKNSVKQSPFQIHFATDMYRFRNLFDKLDLNEDKILKREEFVENIYIDSECSRILDKVVTKIKIIDKKITYRQIIGFMLDDYRKEKNEKLKKSKEYITFNRFCEYFQLPETINLKSIDRKKNSKTQKTLTNEVEIFDIEEENLMILKDVFDTIPRVYQDFIVTADFIQTALMDPQVLSFQEDMCRIQSVETNLPIETVRLTLQRMIKETDEYVDWETAKCFFSRRGIPMDWNQALIKEKKAIRNEQRSQSINEALKRELILKNQLEVSAKMNSQYQAQQRRQSENNFTIPQPFKITDELKQKDKQKNISKGEAVFKDAARQFSKTQQQFKAKPINKEIFGSKPELIQGKRPQSSSKEPAHYKYENYENDRIQRALKKAEEKYELQQRQKQIKEMTNIKANKIGVDLTKTLFDVLKEEKKKVKTGNQPKKPLTELEKSINERLHPVSKNDEQKIKKLQEKKKKQEEAEKEINEKKKKENLARQDLVKKTTEEAEKAKRKKEEADRKLKQAAAGSEETFKPKLNPKKQLTEKEMEEMQKAKRNRDIKKQEQIEQVIKQREARRKRIMERELKDPYLKIDDPTKEPLSPEEIIKNIYSINIFEILVDKQQKEEFNNDHDFMNMDKKERQIYLIGQANKNKIIMEKEEKVIKELKVRETEEKQQSNIKVQDKSTISQKGKSDKMKNDMIFHGSKALQRYRKIQQGLAPSQVPSEFDRYKDDDFEAKNYQKKSKQIIELGYEEEEDN